MGSSSFKKCALYACPFPASKTHNPKPPPDPQANGACSNDNADALTHHELLLPGHLLAKFFKERLEDCLIGFKELVAKDLDKSPEGVNLQV